MKHEGGRKSSFLAVLRGKVAPEHEDTARRRKGGDIKKKGIQIAEQSTFSTVCVGIAGTFLKFNIWHCKDPGTPPHIQESDALVMCWLNF
jgi:hypothetical protein